MTDNFKLWFHESSTATPKLVAAGIQEPAEAVDRAEEELELGGIIGVSWCEIIFNGNTDPHTSVYFMGDGVLGIWNDPAAMWPVFYPPDEDGGSIVLEDRPKGYSRHKKDEDASKMKIDGQDDEEETWEDDEDDDEDGNSADDDGEHEDDGSGDDGESDSDDETDSEGRNDTEEESDEDGGDEMPRLKIFAKLKGPKGWRKRADAEELLERNVFGFKVGVLDPDESLTPAKRESNVRVQVEFIENDSERSEGVLRIKLPEHITLEDFKQLRSGWVVVGVSYGEVEEYGDVE